MARKVLIQIYHGLEMNIGNLNSGELGYCTDTNKLYIGTATGNVLLVASQTAGDMLKSIYDTDNNGIVDAAESVPWSGVSGKPSTFTPATHIHDDRYYTEIETNTLLASKADKSNIVNAINAGAITVDPNTTQDSYVVTNHANTPGQGAYWHILTFFYSSKMSNKAQIALSYNGDIPRLFIRHYYTSWNSWSEVLTTGNITWGQLKGV